MITTGYDNRILVVEVTSWSRPGARLASPYIFTVPYRSLARTLQFIRRHGGKINRIAFLSALSISEAGETDPLRASISGDHALIDPAQRPLDDGAASTRLQSEISQSPNRSIERIMSIFKKMTRRRSDD